MYVYIALNTCCIVMGRLASLIAQWNNTKQHTLLRSNNPTEQKQQDQMSQRLHISWHRLLPCMTGNTVLPLLTAVELKLVHARTHTHTHTHVHTHTAQNAGQTVPLRSGRLCNRGAECTASDGNDPWPPPLASQFVISDPATVTGDRLMIVPWGCLGQIGWAAATGPHHSTDGGGG